MPLPPFDAFARPVLRALATVPSGMSKRDLYARVASDMQVSEADRSEEIASGQTVFENRVGWACSWMKACGWVSNPKRAWWVITPAGEARLANPETITAVEMRPAADKRVVAAETASAAVSTPSTTVLPPTEVVATPEERIADAVAEIVNLAQDTVLERLLAGSPLFFERTVLKLLASMGYAGELGGAEHTGKTADGGVDGILYLDRLHLERVYVQAKRWKEPIGASTVRDFAGAMDAEAATKGVILTTSGFTKEARRYVEKSPKAIRLVDGPELAKLMVEFGVGVSRTQVVVLPKLDEDFFDDA